MLRCNLCGCEIEGFGNNPAPLMLKDDERCCYECNWKYVIPARLVQLSDSERLTDSEIAELVTAIRKENRLR